MRIPKPISERRRAVRVDTELPFRVAHRSYELEAITVNLSSKGVYFRVEKDIPMMTKLHLAILLPGSSKALRAESVVVRKEKDERSGAYFIAAYFSEIKPADRRTLEQFIQSRVQP